VIYAGGTPHEPEDARLLAIDRGAIVRIAPTGTRTPLIRGAQAAAYSPDGTFVAFVRSGDLWLANADGSGPRRLVQTPNVAESAPSWLPSGKAIVYTAEVEGLRQIRVVTLPTGPTTRIASSNTE
jgi:Tol biopolymer transport system component